MNSKLFCCLTLIVSAHAWSWVPFDGQNFPTYPNDGYPDEYFDQESNTWTVWHHCRVNNGGTWYTGTVHEDDGYCQVTLVDSPGVVQPYNVFEIFTLGDNEIVDYSGRREDGIQCEDGNAFDCRLGMTIGTQGLECLGILSKIITTSNLLSTSYYVDATNGYRTCAYYWYMFVKPTPSG